MSFHRINVFTRKHEHVSLLDHHLLATCWNCSRKRRLAVLGDTLKGSRSFSPQSLLENHMLKRIIVKQIIFSIRAGL